ncbi:hypothetical protein QJQ45_017823, partial [Haematococcus lacustris]
VYPLRGRPKWWRRGSTFNLCFGWRPAARGRCSPACCWGSWCAAASRVTVLADGQELLEEIPAEDAFIPVLAERNLYLQLGRGTPPPGMQSRPSLDRNTVDDVGQKLETSFANSLTELFKRGVGQAVALAGAGVIAGSHEHQRRFSCKAHHIKLDTQAIYGLMRAAGMLPADITSLTKLRNGVAGPKDSEVANRWIAFLPDQSLWPNDGQTFAQVVHTDGVTVSMLFTRPKPAGPPDELPRMGKQEGAVNPLAHMDADWLGCDPGKTNMATVAHEERYPSGAVESVWQRSLIAGHYYRQSGITQHAKVSKACLAGQCAVASHQLHRLAAAVLGVRRHDAGDLARHVGRAVQAALIQRQIPAGTLKLGCHRSPPGPGLWVSSFSGSGSIGSRGVPVKQMLREACKQFPGRVVMVHEFRTSRVSSARTNVMAGQAESFRWLLPVRSMATQSRMCSTSNGIRFYDRDVSAALNIRRIAAGPGRPRELSSWVGAMPNPGRPGQEWVLQAEARPGHHKHNMASVRALSPKIGPASPRGFSNHISTRSRVATACLPRPGTVATVSLCALFALSFFGSIITMHAQTSPVSAAAPSTFAANQQYQDELLAAIRMRKEALEPMVQAPDVVVGEGAVPSPAPTPAEAPPTLAVEATVAEPPQPQPTADPPAAAEPALPQPAASAVLAATPTPQAAPAMGVPEPSDPLPGPAAQPAEPAAAPAPASPAAATPQAPVQAAAAEVAPEVSAPSAPSPAVSGGEPAPMEVATTQAPPSNAALALGAVAVLAVAAVAVAGGNKAADQPEQPSTAQSPNTDAGGAVTRTSNTTHNASTMRKLVKELSDLHDQPPEGIRVIVNDANVWDVAFEVEGPSATPFEGGVFKGRLVLGPDFPVAPPKGFFITKIFHPNVSQSGEICVNVLKKDWTADTGLRHVLVVIKCLLVDPNPESALNEEAGRLLLEDYEEYAGKARLMTSIHARRGHGPLATSNGHANFVPVTAANDSCATQKSSVITDISMSPASKKSRGDMLPKPAAQVAASKVKKSLKRL